MTSLSANFTAEQLVKLTGMFEIKPDVAEAVVYLYLRNVAMVVVKEFNKITDEGGAIDDSAIALVLSTIMRDSARQEPLAMSKAQKKILKNIDF
jgi:hypothetical protein